MRSVSHRVRPRPAVAAGALSLLAAGLAPVGCSDLGPLALRDLAVVDDSVADAYHQDAAVLALRVILEEDGEASREVELPAERVEAFHDALLRVYAARHPARDSVVGVHRIHTFANPGVHGITVSADPGADWMRSWLAGERFTGYAPVDSLIRAYDLQLVDARGSVAPPTAVLSAERPLNTVALAHRFAGIDGVRSSSADGMVGSGADIRAEMTERGVKLEYELGWGDCLSGCLNGRTWTFLVEPNGTVWYLGSRGDSPPPQ